MRKLFALRHSASAIAVLLAVAGWMDGIAATRSPAPTGAPPANTATPPTSAPATGMPAAPGSSASVPASDRNFVTQAASSGMLEVDASRLALQRSKDAQVRTFAQRMVDDHTKASADLKTVAKKAGLGDVPTSMTSMHNGHLERLRALSGQSFDREYAVQVGVAAHTEAVALFDKASKDVINPELRAFAGATLPKLREHLKQSQALAQSVGVPDDRMKAASSPPDSATRGAMGATGTGTTGADTTGGASGSASSGSTPGASGTGAGSGTRTDPTKPSTGK